MSDSIGQIIARARNQKKLTLEQVYRALKIKERYIVAIEEDRFDDLPSRVQGRGFIRMYWDYLKLPASQLESILNPASTPAVIAVPENKFIETSDHTRQTELNGNIPDSDPPSGEESANISYQSRFDEIGTKLRNQRERISLSIESVESITHIPSHYLLALESGKFDDLPSPVQGRGMLSNYAGFLDLDSDDILIKYAEALQLKRKEALEPVVATKKKKSFHLPKPGGMRKQGLAPARNIFSLDILIVILLVVVTFGSLIWGASAIVSYQIDPKATKTAQALIDALVQTATADAALTPSPTVEITATSTAEVIVAEQGPTQTIQAPAVSNSPVSIFIVANQRAYMQVLVDGKVAFNGRVIPGNPYLFNGAKQVELISGNAAALQVLFNQNDLGSLGPQGTVLHLIFSINAFGTPTLTPSTTPTQTLVPSKTPMPSNTYPPTKTPKPTSTPYPTRTRTPTRTPTL